MATPAAIKLFFVNERRLRGTFKLSRRSFMGVSFPRIPGRRPSGLFESSERSYSWLSSTIWRSCH